ncbi:MAG: hypothetical protein Q9163_000863 [Psora crenata]
MHITTSRADPNPDPHVNIRFTNPTLRALGVYYVAHWRPGIGSLFMPLRSDEFAESKREQDTRGGRGGGRGGSGGGRGAGGGAGDAGGKGAGGGGRGAGGGGKGAGGGSGGGKGAGGGSGGRGGGKGGRGRGRGTPATVEFKVNDVKQNYAMKLGEGGEAFFVFETFDDIPESLQTSPVISPAASPQSFSVEQPATPHTLQEPEYLDLNFDESGIGRAGETSVARPTISESARAKSDFGTQTPFFTSPDGVHSGQAEPNWLAPRSSPQIKRSASEELLPRSTPSGKATYLDHQSIPPLDRLNTGTVSLGNATSVTSERSASPPPASADEAVHRAKALSEKLSGSNIPSRITDSGDLMLDMTGYKSSEEDALRAEVVARKILAEELEGNYDIGALIGADDQGNLWIYGSEEAKEAASRKNGFRGLAAAPAINDAVSDPGYHSNDEAIPTRLSHEPTHQRTKSDAIPVGLVTPPVTAAAEATSSGDPNRNYAKTLRLTSDQLKALLLKPGANSMSFSVNRATCQAHMYYWTYDVPIVISDIDGTITK